MQDQDVASTLRLLAATRPRVNVATNVANSVANSVATGSGRAGGRSDLGLVGFTLPRWQLTLAGVSPDIRSILTAAQPGDLQLTASGRYGKHWWIEVAGAEPEPLTILASHLRLNRRGDDGPGPRNRSPYSSPADVTVTTARPASSEAARSTTAENPQSWSPAGSSKI